MIFKYLSLPSLFKGKPSSSIHDFTVNDISGNSVKLKQFAGKKILIVNTASECGLTPQYKDLEELYKKYKDHNFTVLGFPSNDFGHQEPASNLEIKTFCERNYGVTFPIMQKIIIKGDTKHPLYDWLTCKTLNGVMDSNVKWNFQKYMIDEKGHLVNLVEPWRNPQCRKIIQWIEKS